MHLVYVDDSSDDCNFQVIAAVIIPDVSFDSAEQVLATIILDHVPEDQQESFEFHAADLLHRHKPFENIKPAEALTILAKCGEHITGLAIPIVYGAVDLRKLRGGLYATAQPIDIAFRVCLNGIDKWLESAPPALGLLIADDTTNQHVKNNMRKSFRSYRRQIKDWPSLMFAHHYLHDSMYFGNSADSIGLQLADVAAYVIRQHLAGKQETEALYKIIEPQIVFGSVEPTIGEAIFPATVQP